MSLAHKPKMSSYMSTPAYADERVPAYGDFSALNLPGYDREIMQAGFDAVESVEGGWEYLKNYEPPANQGFMFSLAEGKRKEIDAAIEAKYPGHSGASYGITMRNLQYIAKIGWDAYAKEKLAKYGRPKAELKEFLDMISPATKDVKEDTALTPEQKREKFLALPTDMSLDEQAKALRELGDVPMSYYEMRMRFG